MILYSQSRLTKRALGPWTNAKDRQVGDPIRFTPGTSVVAVVCSLAQSSPRFASSSSRTRGFEPLRSLASQAEFMPAYLCHGGAYLYPLSGTFGRVLRERKPLGGPKFRCSFAFTGMVIGIFEENYDLAIVS